MAIQRGWVNLVRGVIHTPGMMMMRVDKPGTGDSEGSCADLDFDSTVAYLRDALASLRARPDVDSTRVYVLGVSVGAYLAPLVARGHRVAGIIAFNGMSPTWLERMVVFERRQRALGGRPFQGAEREMQGVIHFLHEYLQRAEPLEQLFQRDPALRPIWASQISFNSATRHYGRPVAFHQQAQRHDFVAALVAAGAPVLLQIGEWDQFESVEATTDVMRLVNRARPGRATLRVYPRMNHQVEYHHSAEDAMTGVNRIGLGADEVVADIRQWIANHTAHHSRSR